MSSLKNASGGEVFEYFGMRFDVDLAEQLIKQSPHESRVAPRAFLESFVNTAEEEPDESGVTHIDITKHHINKEHLPEVDITQPGIVAQMTFKAEKGRPEQHFSMLIDGNHRAVKALKENKEFRVYVLTPEESWKVMAKLTYPPLLKHYINPTKKKKAAQLLFHGSQKKFPVGFVLLPQSDGYAVSEDEDIANTERILEAHRPATSLPRSKSVFMVGNPWRD